MYTAVEETSDGYSGAGVVYTTVEETSDGYSGAVVVYPRLVYDDSVEYCGGASVYPIVVYCKGAGVEVTDGYTGAAVVVVQVPSSKMQSWVTGLKIDESGHSEVIHLLHLQR